MNTKKLCAYFLFFIILILCLSSLTSCGRSLLTREEYQQTKGEINSESFVDILQEPRYDKDNNSIVCEYRAHHTNIELINNHNQEYKHYKQYGNVIDSYWVCKSLFDIKKTLAKTTVIESTFLNPEIWIAETVKIKPQLNCQYWLEIYERSPWKNKESLLLRSKTFDY